MHSKHLLQSHADLISQKARLGLFSLHQQDQNGIEASLDAIENGTSLPSPPSQIPSNALAISYVHDRTKYPDIRGGKFAAEAKQRLVTALVDLQPSAVWLDQCFLQRHGDACTVLGLVPYATMRVLVLGNVSNVHDVVQSYLSLKRFEQRVLTSADELMQAVKHAWESCDEASNEHCIDFVDMCRFWPMIERATARKAKGLTYETQTLAGLRSWTRVLDAALREAKRNRSQRRNLCKLLADMRQLLQYALPSDHDQGAGHNALSALAIATSALGSGSLHNAKLARVEDRECLLVAGMCLNVLMTTPLKRKVSACDLADIVQDPYGAFGKLAERVPAIFDTTAAALARANVLYDRATSEMGCESLADEVTVFEDGSEGMSRRWNGQWELIPHLAKSMRGRLVDIGERSMNAEPYEKWMLMQSCSTLDVTAKSIRAALCRRKLTEDGVIPIVALSRYSVAWTLSEEERLVFEQSGLGGWTSSFLFLAMCDTTRRSVSVQAVAVVHMTFAEEDRFEDGGVPQSAALQWVRNLLKRSACPQSKRRWINAWMATHFDGGYEWYCGVPEPIHLYTWQKWLDEPREDVPNTSVVATFAKVACVGVETLATTPQLALEDVLLIVRIAMTLSDNSNCRQVVHTSLGLLSGLYYAHDTSDSFKLMLPACPSAAKMELCSSDILQSDSPFMLGLQEIFPDTDDLDLTVVAKSLHCNSACPDTFCQTRQQLLDAMHVEAMLLLCQLICITAAMPPQTLAPKPHSDERPACLERSIDALVARLHPDQDHQPLRALLEHVVSNSQQHRKDWRIGDDLRRALPAGDADLYVHAICEELDDLHACMQHLRDAKLVVKQRQGVAEGTKQTLAATLDFKRKNVECNVGSIGDVVQHADLDELVKHDDVEGVEKRLVLTLEFGLSNAALV